jgi:hypothetical protein
MGAGDTHKAAPASRATTERLRSINLSPLSSADLAHKGTSKSRTTRTMRQAISFALVMFAATSTTANAAPPPEEVVVNLVTGYCFSEKMGTPLPAGSIDPRAVGIRLTARDNLARLNRTALRIPTGTGAVYHDYDANYCHVHASGIDPARTIDRVESEFKRRGLTFDRAPVRGPQVQDDQGKAKDGKRYPAQMLIMRTPVSNPNVPIISVTYDNDPRVLSLGVIVHRQQ